MVKHAGETETHFILQHPNGSTFKVAKAGLAKGTLQKISALPKLSKGGKVERRPENPHSTGSVLVPSKTPGDLHYHIVGTHHNVGGTVKDGSTDEHFVFGPLTFDIEKARRIAGHQTNATVAVTPDWSKNINIDKESAMNGGSDRPVFIAQIPTTNGVEKLLIDGHHRMYRAVADGEKTLPAFVFTPKDTVKLIDTHPDRLKKMKEHLGKIQNFSKGGIVKRMAEGGEVEDSDTEEEPNAEPTQSDLASQAMESGISPESAMNVLTAGKGEDEEEEEAPESQQPAPSAGPTPTPAPSGPMSQPQVTAAAEGAAQAPVAAPPMGPPAPQAAAAPGVPQPPFFGALQQALGAYSTVGQATKEEQEAKSQALSNFAAQQAQTAQFFQNKMSENTAATQKLKTDIANTKIDPNRIWHEAGAGAKAGAVLSLILGGISQGLTGRANPASQTLQTLMDRDLEAQRLDLGKKESLLSRNMQEFGNIHQAMLATQIQQRTILEAHLQKIAADSGSAQAMARAQIASIPLQEQVAGLQFQLAGSQAQAMSLGLASGKGGIPVGQEPWTLLSNPDYQKRRVDVNGIAYQARDEKAAGEMANMQALHESINKDVTLLKSIGSSIDPADRARVKAAMNRIAMAVNEFNGYKRFTDMDFHAIQGQFNNPNSLASIVTGQGATNDTLMSMQNKLEAERRNNLLGYKPRGTSFVPGQ